MDPHLEYCTHQGGPFSTPVVSVAMATLLRFFGVLNILDVPQTKPLRGFSPNFQGMFSPRGSRAG